MSLYPISSKHLESIVFALNDGDIELLKENFCFRSAQVQWMVWLLIFLNSLSQGAADEGLEIAVEMIPSFGLFDS